MTLEYLKAIWAFVGDAGLPGAIAFVLLSMWKGWLITKREADDLHSTIKTQEATISLLEATNDRLLDEIAKPLSSVLASLPTTQVRRR